MEHKLNLIQKALLNPSCNIKMLAKEGNVGYSSLQKWIKQHRENQLSSPITTDGRRPQDWPRAERIQTVLECESLTGEALGGYCRQKGLYPSQITEWKAMLMTENPKILANEHKRKQQQLEAEVKALKKELRRKDKALAEASALLILKKKVDLIWGEPEDD